MRDPEFHEFDRDLRDFGPPPAPRPDFWQRMTRGMEALLYLVLLAAIFRLFDPELDKQRKLDAEIARIERVKSERESRVAELRQEYDLLKNDREYLETVARDRLDKARDGEYVIRIEREAAAVPTVNEGPRVVRPLAAP